MSAESSGMDTTVEGGEAEVGFEEAMEADIASAEAGEIAEIGEEAVDHTSPAGDTLTPEDTGVEALPTKVEGEPDVSFFDDEISKLEDKPDKAPDAKLETPEGLGDKANERFQELANTVREQQGALTQNDQYIQDLTRHTEQVKEWASNQVGQARQYTTQLQTEVQQLKDQVQQLAVRPSTGEQDPVAGFEQQLLQKAKEERASEFEALRGEFTEFKEASQKREQKLQHQTRSAEHKQAAMDATRNITLAGMPDEIVQELGPVIAAQVMTTSLYQQTSYEDAARMQRLSVLKLGRAMMRVGAKGLKESLDKSKTAPAVADTSQAGVKGSAVKIPTTEELAVARKPDGSVGYFGEEGLFEWSVDHGVVLPG